MTEQANPVSRWFRRITKGAGPVASVPARLGTPVAECRPREVVEVVGRITAVDAHREEERRWTEATLADETGALRLLWMGQLDIPGIEAGRELRVVGRLSEADGQLTIFNPRYELRSA